MVVVDAGHRRRRAAARRCGCCCAVARCRDARGRCEPDRRHARRRAALELQPNESWPFYGEDEIAAVVALLRSGKVNQWTGSKVFEFEQAYTGRLRNGRAIALANGSVALELALRAFGIGPGSLAAEQYRVEGKSAQTNTFERLIFHNHPDASKHRQLAQAGEGRDGVAAD